MRSRAGDVSVPAVDVGRDESRLLTVLLQITAVDRWFKLRRDMNYWLPGSLLTSQVNELLASLSCGIILVVWLFLFALGIFLSPFTRFSLTFWPFPSFFVLLVF